MRVTKYFAGNKYVTHLIAAGIDSISYKNPDNIKAGRNAARMANWLATNWFLAKVEMSKP